MSESQDEFVASRHHRWGKLDRLLGNGRQLHKHDGVTISRTASLYRSLCNDLMRSRSLGYTPDLVDYLNSLAGRAHNALYGARPFQLPQFFRMLLLDFPRAFRRNINFFWLSLLLFCIPCAIGVFGALNSPDFAAEIVPEGTLAQMAEAYSQGFGDGRSEGTDAQMAGFYVYNNVGIAFRCFATGILFGAGSLFFLIYNGLMIGTVTGYVASAGHAHNILTFMCTHGTFELTAIIISGQAGLRMGYSLVVTNGLTRIGSLRHHAPEIARLVLGAAAMLVIAAAIEGFWSPSSIPAPVKWTVAAILMGLIIFYLAFVGRRGQSTSAPQPWRARE